MWTAYYGDLQSYPVPVHYDRFIIRDGELSREDPTEKTL